MELNLNSLHAKIFRTIMFATKYDMPKSLCAYFWQSVFMWLFMPLLIALTLPFHVYKAITKDKNQMDFFGAVKLSIPLYFLSLAIASSIFSWVYYAIGQPENLLQSYEPFIRIGQVSTFIVSFSIILFGTFYFVDYLRKKKYFSKYKEPKPNVIIEALKGVYNRYCPRITWED